MSRLTANDVAAIRAAYAAGGESYRTLAEQYSVSRMTIRDIVNRVTWRTTGGTVIRAVGSLERAHSTDSGYDVRCTEAVTLSPSSPVVTVGTGVLLELPRGIEAQVKPRSGLAARHGVMAAWGTVDSGYRGEIMITLVRVCAADAEPVTLAAGSRIAQIVFAAVLQVEVQRVDEIAVDTDRGSRGHGSTGHG